MLKVKKVKPLFTKLVTTMDTYEQDVTTESGIITKAGGKGTVKEVQTVIAVSDHIKGIKEGDRVAINPTNYRVLKNDPNSVKNDIEGGNSILGYKFNIIEVDGKNCLLLDDRDIDYVITEWEEPEIKTSSIYQPPKDIIV